MQELERIEIELLLEGIFRRYGYDFREYAGASLRRRIQHVLQAEGLRTVSRLQEKILRDPACMERLLLAFTVRATAMFRDPGFFLAFRREVVPLLRTYPSVRIWHAGCSSGEEVYSMAILLHEEGLYHRCRLYATDLNETTLRRGQEGTFPLEVRDEYARNYQTAGGTKALSDYYTSRDGVAVFRPWLKENVTFLHHNLAMDRSFNEFNAILCRNVMIYFAPSLQQRVHALLYESLTRFGVLGLGSVESLQSTPHEKDYAPLEQEWKLFRRIQ